MATEVKLNEYEIQCSGERESTLCQLSENLAVKGGDNTLVQEGGRTDQ